MRPTMFPVQSLHHPSLGVRGVIKYTQGGRSKEEPVFPTKIVFSRSEKERDLMYLLTQRTFLKFIHQ